MLLALHPSTYNRIRHPGPDDISKPLWRPAFHDLIEAEDPSPLRSVILELKG